MKVMTERDKVLGDVSDPARSDINYNVILTRCVIQSVRDQRSLVWESSLYEKMSEDEGYL